MDFGAQSVVLQILSEDIFLLLELDTKFTEKKKFEGNLQRGLNIWFERKYRLIRIIEKELVLVIREDMEVWKYEYPTKADRPIVAEVQGKED